MGRNNQYDVNGPLPPFKKEDNKMKCPSCETGILNWTGVTERGKDKMHCPFCWFTTLKAKNRTTLKAKLKSLSTNKVIGCISLVAAIIPMMILLIIQSLSKRSNKKRKK